MYKHLLIATDGSERAQRALEMGLGLAKQIGAKATIITITAPLSTMTTGDAVIFIPPDDYDRGVKEHTDSVMQRALASAKRLEMTCDTLSASDAQPANAIVDAARERGCDLIVVGSHGRSGLARFFLGSETVKILTLATIPVLVHRD
jgi:nucleotide-binding universal stress UspA family protein